MLKLKLEIYATQFLGPVREGHLIISWPKELLVQEVHWKASKPCTRAIDLWVTLAPLVSQSGNGLVATPVSQQLPLWIAHRRSAIKEKNQGVFHDQDGVPGSWLQRQLWACCTITMTGGCLRPSPVPSIQRKKGIVHQPSVWKPKRLATSFAETNTAF